MLKKKINYPELNFCIYAIVFGKTRNVGFFIGASSTQTSQNTILNITHMYLTNTDCRMKDRRQTGRTAYTSDCLLSFTTPKGRKFTVHKQCRKTNDAGSRVVKQIQVWIPFDTYGNETRNAW